MAFEQIALRIRDIRKTRNMTQEEVAKTLGISRQAYIRLESGYRDISLKEVHMLADLFKVDFKEITAIEEDKPTLLTMCRDEEFSPIVRECIEKTHNILEHFVAQERLFHRMSGGDS